MGNRLEQQPKTEKPGEGILQPYVPTSAKSNDNDDVRTKVITRLTNHKEDNNDQIKRRSRNMYLSVAKARENGRVKADILQWPNEDSIKHFPRIVFIASPLSKIYL